MTDKILIDRAVVEQALEAFELHADQYPHMVKGYTLDAAEALRAALEQPVEQEPVAWADEIIEYLHAQYDTEGIKELNSGDALIRLDGAVAAVEEVEQRYTHPQPRRPLTDEAIAAIIESNFVEITNQNLYDAIYLCMRDVESAHDIEAARGIGGEK